MGMFTITRTHEIVKHEDAGVRGPVVTAMAEVTVQADTWPEALTKFEADAPAIFRLSSGKRDNPTGADKA